MVIIEELRCEVKKFEWIFHPKSTIDRYSRGAEMDLEDRDPGTNADRSKR